MTPTERSENYEVNKKAMIKEIAMILHAVESIIGYNDDDSLNEAATKIFDAIERISEIQE